MGTELLGNLWTFLNEGLKKHFSSGLVIEEHVFKQPSDSEEEIVHLDTSGDEVSKTNFPCAPPVSIGSVCRCTPKLQGVKIKIGSLSRDEVINSLQSYHELAGQWPKAILRYKNIVMEFNIEKLECKLWPNYVMDSFTYLDTGMVAPSFEDEDSVFLRSIKNDIKLIKSVSKKHKAGHSAYHTPGRTHLGSPVPPSSDAASITSNSTVVVKEKNVRMIAFYKIFFSTRIYSEGTNSYNLALGNISEDFMEALEAT